MDFESTKVLQEFVYFDGKIRHQPFSVTQPNKFGISHPIQISTGSKALLLALYSSTSIVNFLETGNNITRCMFKYFNDRDIKIYLPQIVVVKNAENLMVLLDGKELVSYDDIS